MPNDPITNYRQIWFVILSVLVVACGVAADINSELMITQTTRESLYQHAVERQFAR